MVVVSVGKDQRFLNTMWSLPLEDICIYVKTVECRYDTNQDHFSVVSFSGTGRVYLRYMCYSPVFCIRGPQVQSVGFERPMI